jgi:hypothetical protein
LIVRIDAILGALLSKATSPNDIPSPRLASLRLTRM